MNLTEARKRTDYNFNVEPLEHFISQIRENNVPVLEGNDDALRGVAVLIIGYVDIELNIRLQKDTVACPAFDYFCCVKYGENDDDWESDDYTKADPQVDWSAENWKELLEQDMLKALDEYVTEHNLSYNNPNN